MIDVSLEKPVRLTAAPKLLGHLLPEARGGGRTAISTWFRWSQKGCRGVRLETVRVGGALCTSEPAVLRFFAALTDPSDSKPTPPRVRRRQIAQADRATTSAGI